jgi:hypothetical protein
MDTKKVSFELFSREHAAGEKFDYFICSIAGALFAYIGQSYTPHRFDSWYYLLIPLALLSLTISLLFGLLLIKISKEITRLNKEYISCVEEIDSSKHSLDETNKITGEKGDRYWSSKEVGYVDRAFIESLISNNKNEMTNLSAKYAKEFKVSKRCEWARNISLSIGFLLILISRSFEAYYIPH